MSWNEKNKIRIAILDLNDGHENQGMRCLRDITRQWGEVNEYDLIVEEFNVRVKNEVPGTDFDIYISSGGPGSPLDSIDSEWEKKYFNWLHAMEQWNNNESNFPKKDPFYAVDSRDYQVTAPDYRKINAMGGKILTLEKERPHVPFERAIMALRF